MYRSQAQPTLNWYGFKQEVEERRVESAAEDRQGFYLVLALAVSASELTSGEV